LVDRPLEYVAGWDLAVSMSTDEGQGLAVLEAMALGVPVLVKPSAGIEDFLCHGQNGFTFPPRISPAVVVEAIADVLANPARRTEVATEARRFVRERYDWRATVLKIDELYADDRRIGQRRAA
jgi:glycosyltransferase involved in cell wall biosynthesis